MLHPSTKRLIDKLSDMTRKQRVLWTEGENASVVHDTEGYRVILTAEPHAVLLTDGVGREIETCTPEEFADDVDAAGRPYARFVAELYREAYRHARGTEQAIRTLMAGLDAADAAPPEPAIPDAAAETIGPLDATTDETAPLENETAITAAVASLANQINAQTDAAPTAEPEPETGPDAWATGFEETHLTEAAPLPAPEAVPDEPIAAAGADDIEAAEPEPGSFGTFGAFATAPGAETPAPVEMAEVVTEPEPPVSHAPETAAAESTLPPAPTLAKPISLSSIPFGFGLGAAQRPGAPSHPATSAPAPEPADPDSRGLIDGTIDLPENAQAPYEEIAAAEPYPPVQPTAGPGDLPDEKPAPLLEPGQVRRFNPWN